MFSGQLVAVQHCGITLVSARKAEEEALIVASGIEQTLPESDPLDHTDIGGVYSTLSHTSTFPFRLP